MTRRVGASPASRPPLSFLLSRLLRFGMVAVVGVLAALFFLLRTQANTMSTPIRQSFLMGVVDEADRSTVAGLSNLPLQALSTVGPTLAGQLMQAAWVSLPLELAAVLQAVNAGLYYAVFRDLRPPEEQTNFS